MNKFLLVLGVGLVCLAVTVTASHRCPGIDKNCDYGSTCCRLSPTLYGCCRVQNAVCCRTGCCPQGHICMDSIRGCLKVGRAEDGSYSSQITEMSACSPMQ